MPYFRSVDRYRKKHLYRRLSYALGLVTSYHSADLQPAGILATPIIEKPIEQRKQPCFVDELQFAHPYPALPDDGSDRKYKPQVPSRTGS